MYYTLCKFLQCLHIEDAYQLIELIFNDMHYTMNVKVALCVALKDALLFQVETAANKQVRFDLMTFVQVKKFLLVSFWDRFGLKLLFCFSHISLEPHHLHIENLRAAYETKKIDWILHVLNILKFYLRLMKNQQVVVLQTFKRFIRFLQEFTKKLNQYLDTLCSQ